MLVCFQQMPEGSSTETVMHVDLKADFLMPQVSIRGEKNLFDYQLEIIYF